MSVFRNIWRTLTLRSGDSWRAWFGGPTASGRSVTPEATLSLSAAWACIRLVSQTVATLPVGMYETNAKGEKTQARGHWLDDLLRNSPNADQTPVEFFEGVLGCLALRGMFYARKGGLRPNGEFASFETMFPDSTTVRRENGGLVFDWVDPDGHKVTLPEREVFFVKGFGMGGDLGLSPIAYARESLGSALAADESAARMFGAGMQPSGFLTVDQELKKPQRDQLEEIMKQFVGSKNAGKLMILEAGMKYSPLMMKPEEAQLLLTRRFNVEEVCRWFNVPPILVGHSPEGQTMWGSGVEQIMIAWLTLGLRPYLVRIEQALQKRALPAAQRPRFKAEFNVEGLMRADSAGRAALYSSFAQNGVMNRDEIRRLENLPPLPGGGDLTVQANLVRLQDLGNQPAGNGQGVREMLRSWLLAGDDEKRAA